MGFIYGRCPSRAKPLYTNIVDLIIDSKGEPSSGNDSDIGKCNPVACKKYVLILPELIQSVEVPRHCLTAPAIEPVPLSNLSRDNGRGQTPRRSGVGTVKQQETMQSGDHLRQDTAVHNMAIDILRRDRQHTMQGMSVGELMENPEYDRTRTRILEGIRAGRIDPETLARYGGLLPSDDNKSSVDQSRRRGGGSGGASGGTVGI